MVSDKRKEFEKVKKSYFKKYLKACVKCGAGDGIHLHHKKALADGGTNDFSNLVPLCAACHVEWHNVEHSTTWETFLEVPSFAYMCLVFKSLEQDKKRFEEIKKAPFGDVWELLIMHGFRASYQYRSSINFQRKKGYIE